MRNRTVHESGKGRLQIKCGRRIPALPGALIALFSAGMLLTSCGKPVQTGTESNLVKEERSAPGLSGQQQSPPEEQAAAYPAAEKTQEVIKECLVTVPGGFVASPDKQGLFVSEDYPIIASNIFYAASEEIETADWEGLTKEIYRENLEKELKRSFGEDIPVDVTGFDKTEIDGSPAFRIQSAYTAQGTAVEQLVCIIPAGGRTFTVTYSQEPEDGNMELFEQSAARLKLIYDK